MKILNASQVREWDQYTIQLEPVSSIDLMERAAAACVDWLGENQLLQRSISIFCGKGNNGGDGLAIARMLSQTSHVKVYILETGSAPSPDFQANLERLHHAISFIKTEKNFPAFTKNEIVIDALFGSGLARPLDGLASMLVEHINQSGCRIISIDLPSGLPVDDVAQGTAVKANDILSFQVFKMAFLLPANGPYVGKVHILDIGLHKRFETSLQSNDNLVDEKIIAGIYKPRNAFAHKGNFGHALIIAGSYGKMGASVLAANACTHAGAGLTTAHVPKRGYDIMQVAVPEVMVSSDYNPSLVTKIEEDLSKFNAIGIGPGIGTASETKVLVQQVFNQYKKPLVIDADALNILGSVLDMIPPGSILTPHPKEFARIFGEKSTDQERFQMAREKSKELNVVIVLKGHHSFIATPGGQCFFNNTGNAGMAKGGSGDVLTGILTALLAQGYSPENAAILGVHLHGLAGDMAAWEDAYESITASDLISHLGKAFRMIASY
jgi:NAD(P)H-hydrate epimerase